jgi:hypothetical protein
MTQEALKLALDALELVNIEFVCNGAHHAKKDRHLLDEDCPVTMRYQTAITAIKEALREHAMREVQRLGQEIEQEPVAYINVEKRRLEFAEPMVWHTPTVVKLERIPLYTHQRKSLSDDLYNELMFAVGNKYPNETRHQTALRYILQAEKGDEKAAHGIKENT